MTYLGKNITAEILLDHFFYFKSSIQNYFCNYQKIIFREGVAIPPHLAYLCPLCLKKYLLLLDDDLNLNASFSLDHIPPKSVGGILELITCKKCNNDAGKFEAELEKKLQYDAFTKKQFPSEIKDTKFRIAGIEGNYASFIKTLEDGTPIIDFPSKVKRKTALLNTWLDNLSKKEDWIATITVPTPNDKKKLKALLKAAYLICFFYWGYEFAYSQNGELIRKVLIDKAEYPMNGPAFWINKNDLENGTEIPLSVGIIEKPFELQSYYVNIPVEKNSVSYVATMLIPNPTEKGWETLSNIHDWLTKNPPKQITFRPIKISLPNIVYGYTQEWDSFLDSTKI